MLSQTVFGPLLLCSIRIDHPWMVLALVFLDSCMHHIRSVPLNGTDRIFLKWVGPERPDLLRCALNAAISEHPHVILIRNSPIFVCNTETNLDDVGTVTSTFGWGYSQLITIYSQSSNSPSSCGLPLSGRSLESPDRLFSVLLIPPYDCDQ